MLFGKKFALLVLGSLGTAGTWRLISSNVVPSNTQISDWETIFKLTQNIGDVELSSEIDENINGVTPRNRFLYSIFGSNLSTFSQEFHKYFYRWALYQWAQWMLHRTEQGSFPELKKKLSEKLKNIPEPKAPLSSENWNGLSRQITDSYNDLNNLFLELLFKEIWAKKDHSDIAWDSEEDLKKYGDLEYAKSMVKFQSFILKEWMTQRKPVKLCRKSWKLNKSFKSNLYKEDGLPPAPTFDFPDYSDVRDQIKQFLDSKKCEEHDLFTTSHLNNMDGREIDAFVSLYFEDLKKSSLDDGEKNNLLPTSSAYQNNNGLSDVNLIFADDCNDCQFPKISENLIDDNGSLKDHKNKTFVPFRKVNWNGNENAIFVRTETGITFLHFEKNEHGDSLKKKLLEKNKTQLATELKNFFSERPGELLGKFFSQADYNQYGKLFGYSQWPPSLYELLKEMANFTEEMSLGERYWNTMTKLSKSVTGYAEVSIGSDKKLEASSGLASPLWLKRNLSSSQEISNGESSSNNGTFNLLTRYYTEKKDWDFSKLRKNASALKKAISSHINSFNELVAKDQGNNRKSYFLGDYVLDNVYAQFMAKDNGTFIKKTTVNLMLANGMGFKPHENNVSDLAKRWSKELKTENPQDLENSIMDSIRTVYYGTKYAQEPLENRLNYGGFKYEEPKNQQNCARYYGGTKAKSDDCSFLESNRKEWTQKMEDYWTMKSHVFGNHGYEIGSEESSKYLRFLFSFNHFIANDFHNLRKFASEKIPSGRYGALLWLDEANVENGGEIGKENKFNDYFKSLGMDSLFNPFFNRSIETKERKKTNLSTGHIGAYAMVGSKERKELFGFKGLYAEELNVRNLPPNVQKSIFDNFSHSNPKNNKNYALDSSVDKYIYGSGFGELDNDSLEGFKKKVDSFNTEGSLKDFLLSTVPELVDEIWSDGKTKNLREIQASVKEKIGDDKYREQRQIITTRFAGLLRNPKAEDSMYKEQPYYIPTKEDETTGNIAYMIQVNRNDFGKGFADFIKLIGSETFMRMAMLLSMEDEAIKDAVAHHVSNRGIIV